MDLGLGLMLSATGGGGKGTMEITNHFDQIGAQGVTDITAHGYTLAAPGAGYRWVVTSYYVSLIGGAYNFYIQRGAVSKVKDYCPAGGTVRVQGFLLIGAENESVGIYVNAQAARTQETIVLTAMRVPSTGGTPSY